MMKMKNLICPISSEKVNESVVRLTALWVVLLTAYYIAVPNHFIPLYLAIDFFIRAFTKVKYSPLSWISTKVFKMFHLSGNLIDKAPKVFAARIGFILSMVMFACSIFGLTLAGTVIASVLVLFAFLECGLNFCAGCWIYTYIVVPFYRDK